MLLLLVLHSTLYHHFHGLAYNNSLTADERYEGVRPAFDVTNQVRIKDEWFAIQSSQFDHEVTPESRECPKAGTTVPKGGYADAGRKAKWTDSTCVT